VTGVGDTFSGRWYVDSVTHKFSADGYRQAFTLVRNGVGDDSPPAGALGGLLGGVL
jgi:phage protein D